MLHFRKSIIYEARRIVGQGIVTCFNPSEQSGYNIQLPTIMSKNSAF